MNELLNDIEKLETAVILLEEGANDEKRNAMYMLQNMIAEKKSQVKSFEEHFSIEAEKFGTYYEHMASVKSNYE